MNDDLYLQLKIAEVMCGVIAVRDNEVLGRHFAWAGSYQNQSISDTEWPYIVDTMIREHLPVNLRIAFMNDLCVEDPADLVLRVVVQKWQKKAEAFFRAMEKVK